MAKKEKPVLLFTVGEGKKEQKLARKDYEAHMLLVAGKKKLKLDKAQVKGLVELAINDDEPADEAPAEILAFFNESIKPDYAKAKEAFEEAEAAALAEENAEAEEQKKIEKEQKTLVAYSEELPDTTDALKTFHDKFDLGPGMTQCVPREGVEVTLTDWVGALSLGVAMESGAQWIIGDAANALSEAGHEGVVEQLAEKFQLEYSTISGFARTAKNFSLEQRNTGLSFQKYREIGNAKFDGDEKKQDAIRGKLLKQAEKGGLTTQAVRAAVREAQGKVDPAPTPSHKYLKLNRENVANSEVLTELPKKIEDHHTIIDLSKKAFLVIGKDEAGKVTQEWTEFAKGN